jgi:hypothetical protein
MKAAVSELNEAGDNITINLEEEAATGHRFLSGNLYAKRRG